MNLCLRVALGIFVLANLGLLLLAGYNRWGPGRGTLMIAECRLVSDPGGDGLIDALLGRRAPLELKTLGRYLPLAESRPLAERLATFGFSVDHERARDAPAKRAYVLVEAEGPHVAALARTLPQGAPPPLVLSDLARDPDRLRSRLEGHPGAAVAKGVVGVREGPQGVTFDLRLATTALALPAADRALLRRLGPPPEGPCRSRFIAEIAYGALSDPIVRGLKPLERARP